MIEDFRHYLKRATTLGFTIGVSLVSILFVVISFFVWQESRDQQIGPWLKIFPQNVLTHLVESDYHPISSKIRLIQKTNLFDQFAVYDSDLQYIDGFGIDSRKLISKDFAHSIKDESGNVWGWYVYHENEKDKIYYLKIILFSTFFLLLFVILLIQLIFNRFVATKVARFSDLIDSIDSVTQKIKASGPDDLTSTYISEGKFEFKEAQQLNSSIGQLINEINISKQRHLESLIEVEKNKTLSSLARQVVHDIRSPLEALKALTPEMSTLTLESRQTVQMIINRIEEIGFKLLKNNSTTSMSDIIEEVNLIELIKELINEKRIEYRDALNLHISDLAVIDSDRFFSKIEPSALKNILSNLINNGIDAIGKNSGRIRVELSNSESFNIISVTDTGSGIDDDIIHSIFQEGFTTKPNGNGIGLSNARKDLLEWQGAINFVSNKDQGTTFFISLPKANKKSESIQNQIDISPYKRIIVVDDDPTVHELWKKKVCNRPIEHFYSCKEVLSNFTNLTRDDLLLSDLDLSEGDIDGIDLISKFSHFEHSWLITAKADDEIIKNRCLNKNIKLISKKDLSNLDIRFNLNTIVLIDDDRLVHLNWERRFRESKFTLASFYSVKDFLNKRHHFKDLTNIYIDSNLGEGLRGEELSEEIFKAGFVNLYLVTGFDPQSIQKPSWIKSVFSKKDFNSSHSSEDNLN
ncbi:MAG: ATP-binding protein [Bacteriovoracaceae bacterium]